MSKRIMLGAVVLGVLAVVVVAAWPHPGPATPAPEPPAKAASLPKPVTAPPPAQTPPMEPAPVPVEAPAPAVEAAPPPAQEPTLTAETLKNTSWSREKFRIDLAPDGSVVIGGNSRAKWIVEGDRVKLYSDTSDEVHYLDIRGSKLYWEGQEIGRAK